MSLYKPAHEHIKMLKKFKREMNEDPQRIEIIIPEAELMLAEIGASCDDTSEDEIFHVIEYYRKFIAEAKVDL